jgi:aryl-alcohol dehydrogenase-like predicted oxidoreductase
MTTTTTTTTTTTSTGTETRTLGRRGPAVSALGVGTWALGGPFTFNDRDAGWGEVDDTESVRALHAAIAAGVTLIDTAPCYGTGHAERVVGRALAELPAGTRDAITVATKFGLVIHEESRTGGGNDVRPETIRAECDASLRRLGVERIGLYQLHGGADTTAQAEDVVATCEELLAAGKIAAYGSSQDDAQTLAVYAGSAASTVQTQVNVFGWIEEVLATARVNGWGVLARSPLAMGMLTGKYTAQRRPEPGDVRLDTPYWDYFDDDTFLGWLDRVDAVRDLLTADGRSLVQGSLAYVLAVDPLVIPLPGIRTVAQAEENAAVLALGPLPAAETAEITRLLADSPERR